MDFFCNFLIYLLIGVVSTIFLFENEYVDMCHDYDNVFITTLFFILFYPILIFKKSLKRDKK